MTQAVQELVENEPQDERGREGNGPDRADWKGNLQKPPDQE